MIIKIVARLSPWRSGFFLVQDVIDLRWTKWHQNRGFLRVLWFSYATIISTVLRDHFHLHVVLTRRANLKKSCALSEIEGERRPQIRKYFHKNSKSVPETNSETRVGLHLKCWLQYSAVNQVLYDCVIAKFCSVRFDEILFSSGFVACIQSVGQVVEQMDRHF
jgi:hypothetical protein